MLLEIKNYPDESLLSDWAFALSHINKKPIMEKIYKEINPCWSMIYKEIARRNIECRLIKNISTGIYYGAEYLI